MKKPIYVCCLLFHNAPSRPVNTTDDGKRLQEDLTELTKWAEKWQMTFHPAKCYILRVTKKKNPIITNYEMLGQQLETVHQYPIICGVYWSV
jgi:hypothetical protein